MSKKKNFNLIMIFSGIKAIDIITTVIGVGIFGAIELHPLGYNIFTISLIPMAIIGLLWFNTFMKSKFFTIGLLILIIVNLIGITNNFYQLTRILS